MKIENGQAIVDDSTVSQLPACARCKHLHEGWSSCDAFDAIPDSVWLHGDPHTQPLIGDHGIQFEEKGT